MRPLFSIAAVAALTLIQKWLGSYKVLIQPSYKLDSVSLGSANGTPHFHIPTPIHHPEADDETKTKGEPRGSLA
jgi:hypothetical protein